MPAEGPVVDAHVHLFSPHLIRERERYLQRDEWFRLLYENPKARMASMEQLLKEMDLCGVEVSLVFGFAFREQALCRETNDYVLEAVSRYPERLVGLACVSPEEPGAEKELERCLDRGLIGCGELFPDGQAFTLTGSTGLDRLAGLLAENGLILLLHSNEPVGHWYPGKGANTPAECFAFAERHPSLDIVFAHLGGGLFLYELMPEVKKALSRVYYDTAAGPFLYRSDVYALAACAAGREKLLFGSDYPLLSPQRYFREMEDLDPATRAALLGGNARRLLNLASRQVPASPPTSAGPESSVSREDEGR